MEDNFEVGSLIVNAFVWCSHARPLLTSNFWRKQRTTKSNLKARVLSWPCLAETISATWCGACNVEKNFCPIGRLFQFACEVPQAPFQKVPRAAFGIPIVHRGTYDVARKFPTLKIPICSSCLYVARADSACEQFRATDPQQMASSSNHASDHTSKVDTKFDHIIGIADAPAPAPEQTVRVTMAWNTSLRFWWSHFLLQFLFVPKEARPARITLTCGWVAYLEREFECSSRVTSGLHGIGKRVLRRGRKETQYVRNCYLHAAKIDTWIWNKPNCVKKSALACLRWKADWQTT